MIEQFNPVGWFEIPVKNISQATSFYHEVLGYELEEVKMNGSRMAMFPMHDGVVGAAGSLVQGESYEPSDKGVLVYFSVQDIAEVLERVKKQGGEILDPKTSIGEHGFIAVFRDTDGNRIAIHSQR